MGKVNALFQDAEEAREEAQMAYKYQTNVKYKGFRRGRGTILEF